MNVEAEIQILNCTNQLLPCQPKHQNQNGPKGRILYHKKVPIAGLGDLFRLGYLQTYVESIG